MHWCSLLTWEEMARIESIKFKLPGVALSVGAKRTYPLGSLTAHLVGYLGEINDSQRAAWCEAISVFDESGKERQLALFPSDRTPPPLSCEVVQVRVNEISLKRPRQWGACWLSLVLWEQLCLDDFWRDRLLKSRKGTRWVNVLKTLVCYRLVDPGSEWRLHRQWFEQSAMGDLLGEDLRVPELRRLLSQRIEMVTREKYVAIAGVIIAMIIAALAGFVPCADVGTRILRRCRSLRCR